MCLCTPPAGMPAKSSCKESRVSLWRTRWTRRQQRSEESKSSLKGLTRKGAFPLSAEASRNCEFRKGTPGSVSSASASRKDETPGRGFGLFDSADRIEAEAESAPVCAGTVFVSLKM